MSVADRIRDARCNASSIIFVYAEGSKECLDVIIHGDDSLRDKDGKLIESAEKIHRLMFDESIPDNYRGVMNYPEQGSIFYANLSKLKFTLAPVALMDPSPGSFLADPFTVYENKPGEFWKVAQLENFQLIIRDTDTKDGGKSFSIQEHAVFYSFPSSAEERNISNFKCGYVVVSVYNPDAKTGDKRRKFVLRSGVTQNTADKSALLQAAREMVLQTLIVRGEDTKPLRFGLNFVKDLGLQSKLRYP